MFKSFLVLFFKKEHFLLVSCLLCVNAAPWYALNPARTLVIDTSKGRIVLDMRPDLAPAAVARIKQLAQEHVYDGLLFHRVIDHFVDQTGNPNNHDGGVSRHPDLAPEFFAKLTDKQIDAVATRDQRRDHRLCRRAAHRRHGCARPSRNVARVGRVLRGRCRHGAAGGNRHGQ